MKTPNVFLNIVVLIGMSIHALWVQSAPDDSLFYYGQDYGSESQFGPLNVLINVGLVVPGRLGTTNRLDDVRFDEGWSQWKEALSHQEDVFEASGGYQSALEKEFIPFAHESGAWVPNYTLHFLGEGMLTRKMEEYYRYHGVTGQYWPKILAISTVTAAQITNEVAEIELPWEQRLDPVADLYFNVAGMIAFSFDGFAKWFNSGTREYYYWPGQPVIDPYDQGLFNQGESYLFRFGEGTKWAVATGMPANGVGFSFPLDDMEFEYFTVLLGSDVLIPKRDEIIEREKHDRGYQFSASDVADEYTLAINTYWDRKGSLMASAALSVYPSAQLNINIFPIFQHQNGWGLGGYFILSDEGASSVGITLSVTPVILGVRS
ncbi:hypothetical protein HF888_09650 [Bermanella marisrubri]|uniref:Uncharacterized protein n=1 Tax=Bermanella marisrubri TaxID=207949 RepID=Q1N699_9GAMM|nr:hypothetical protein [Bermanella marisrubri]EAT13693.1 hypothetical protein RED65_09884 [Oceanobacter sp. RED65] [Bermanella marisrubri]QIZ84471.1 hypothetical protein HF888_09650 [Bermanella marisrubri]